MPPKPIMPPKPTITEKPMVDEKTKESNITKVRTINREIDALVKAKNSKGAVKRSIASTPEKDKRGQDQKYVGTKTARRHENPKPK